MSRFVGLCFVALLALAQMAPAALACCLNTVCLGQETAAHVQTDHDSCCAKKALNQTQRADQQCDFINLLNNTHWLKQTQDSQPLEISPTYAYVHQIKNPLIIESNDNVILADIFNRPDDLIPDQSLRVLRSTQILI